MNTCEPSPKGLNLLAADMVFARRLPEPLVVGLAVVGIGASAHALPADGSQRFASAVAPLSAAAKAARLPCPPEELVDACQERMHEETGPARAGKGVKTGSGF